MCCEFCERDASDAVEVFETLHPESDEIFGVEEWITVCAPCLRDLAQDV